MLQSVVVDLDCHDDDDRTVARLLQCAEEEEGQQRAACLTVEAVVLEAAVDEATDAACEALVEDLVAQERVLSGLHNVPASFARTLLAHFVPDIAHLLDNECFICLATLTDYRGVRYLTCCDGGAFACPACVEGHAARVGHPLRAEERIVALVAQLRRSLCR